MDNKFLINDSTVIPGLSLFNTLKYHNLHKKSERDYYFSFVGNEPLAVVRFLEKEPGNFASPLRGTFGGFELASEDLSLPEMEDFVSKVEAYLKENGAKKVTITLPPFVYNSDQTSLWMNILERSGFNISTHDLNYSMDVKDCFSDKIDKGNRKRLNQCLDKRLSFCQLPQSEYKKAYDVLRENREKKGIAISMTWDAIKEMCDALPEDVKFFGASQGDKLIASALCLHINPQSLYVFYWGEIAGVEGLSPVTFLANGIYFHCLKNNIKTLDLGISTLNGVPNYGLIRYKKNLGCSVSSKFTLTKDL